MVMVSGKEEPESSLPPSMDGLLRVHMRIVDGLDGEASQAPPASKVSTRLLVPASQAGSLIGKQGGTVKAIQEASGCIVRVLGSEDVPVFALQDDRVVEVVGEPTSVHKALELIASHLRKFMVDRSIIPFFENQMQKPTRQMDHMPPPHQAWGPPQGHAPRSGQGGYGHNPPPYLQPPPRHDSYYSPPEMRPPTMEKQPHQDISAYGREPPMNVHVSSAPPMVAQIPLSHTDTVIGTSGSNKSYTRLLSGATVTSQETRGLPCEMTVEVSRTGSQVQTAMAEAGALAPAHGSAMSTTISLSERYMKNPRLGTEFTTSYKIKGNKKLRLIGRNGFIQEVTTRVEKRHRVVDRISLGSGWKNFVEAENLEIGDTITFGSGGDYVLILLEVEKNQQVWEDHDTQAEAKYQQVWEDHDTQAEAKNQQVWEDHDTQADQENLGIWIAKSRSLEETCSSQSDYIMMLKETCSSQEDAIKSLEKELAEKLKLVDELKNTISAKDEQLCKGELCRKSLLDTIIELRGKVRVFCRVRPGHEEANVIAYPTSTVESPGTDIELIQHGEKHSFTFDKVFDHRATQEEVFTEISELVQSALDGNKVCVFAYGQTGSGKTYTMMGRPGQKGLIPRSLKQLFEASESLGAQGWKYELQVSVLEIYNEKFKDLLLSESESLPAFFSKKINHKKKKRFLLRKLSKRPVRSELTTETVCNIEQIESILEEASQRRSVAKTQMNEYSSRSHFIISLQISGLNLVKSKKEVKGVLNLVDLAGSASKNKAEGERLKEAQAINKSLSALGDVMHALATNTPHVPFRNSKLTYLLKPWLEGNSKTLMLVNISPDQSSTVESLSSLKFAARVNSIFLR